MLLLQWTMGRLERLYARNDPVPILTPAFPFLLENMHAFIVRLNERRLEATKAAAPDVEVQNDFSRGKVRVLT